ncbi:MAG: lipase maturation factor family protein, partial [Polyangiaceae bacterium]|nr:lipase maturation factor family protein [Polyangiaceae bacterium]
GMIAVFLAPWRGAGPFGLLPRTRAPAITLWLLRWLVFRIMLGAGLIKLRGDPCWLELTCLDTHFETQPNPSPLSPLFHHAPHAVHVAGVLFNHLAELVAPWFVFGFGFPALRRAAGAVILAFQVTLIASGNLSFLNWLTLVPVLACFDDAWLARTVLSRAPRARAWLLARVDALPPPSRAHSRASIAYALVVCVLSVAPAANLASSHQAMNASYDPLALVNTYGAFGSVDRKRFEVILEGTADDPSSPLATWREYPLPCMPGDPARRPCFVSPYQHRLDWQMWFVGNWAGQHGGLLEHDRWLVHFVWQLLRGEPQVKRLLASDPFPHAPPRAIRIGIWRYELAPAGSRDYWKRRRVGEFLAPVTLGHPALRQYIRSYDWPDALDDASGAPPDTSAP